MMKITLCTLLPLALAASAMAATSNEGTGSNVKDPATKAPIGDKAGDARKAKLPKGGNVKATQPKAGKGSLDLPPPSLDDPDHYFITISSESLLRNDVYNAKLIVSSLHRRGQSAERHGTKGHDARMGVVVSKCHGASHAWHSRGPQVIRQDIRG